MSVPHAAPGGRLQKPRGARPLWVVLSGACTLTVAVHPPRSSHQAGLPLFQQTRSQVFQAHPLTLVWEGPPASMGGQVSMSATGTPSLGRRTSGTGDQQGLWEPALQGRGARRPCPWGGCDELVWTIRGVAGRWGPRAEEQGSWWWDRSTVVRAGELQGRPAGSRPRRRQGSTWVQA